MCGCAKPRTTRSWTASRGSSTATASSSGPPRSLQPWTEPPSRSGGPGAPPTSAGRADAPARRAVSAPGAADPIGAVVVAAVGRPLERLEQEVLLGSLVVAGLILLAGGLAIRSAVDGALRPVVQMTASAEDWGAHDLDRRFDLGPPRDELTGLAATLDHLLARIAASRRHEQRFASEMAHELRTPLAGLRARAELALGARGPAPAPSARPPSTSSSTGPTASTGRSTRCWPSPARSSTRRRGGRSGRAGRGVRRRRGRRARRPAACGGRAGRRAPRARAARRQRPSPRPLACHDRALGGRRATSAPRSATTAPASIRGLATARSIPACAAPTSDGGGAGLGLSLARRLARSCGGDVVAGDGPGGCFVLVLPGGPRHRDPASHAVR